MFALDCVYHYHTKEFISLIHERSSADLLLRKVLNLD